MYSIANICQGKITITVKLKLDGCNDATLLWSHFLINDDLFHYVTSFYSSHSDVKNLLNVNKIETISSDIK